MAACREEQPFSGWVILMTKYVAHFSVQKKQVIIKKNIAIGSNIKKRNQLWAMLVVQKWTKKI